MSNLVAICTSPNRHSPVIAGPYRHWESAMKAVRRLEHKGWDVQLQFICRTTEVEDLARLEW